MSRKHTLRSTRNSQIDVNFDDEPGPSQRSQMNGHFSQKSARNNSIDDSDEDELSTQSRRSINLPEDEENHALGSLLSFLLSANIKKEAIKHTDIKNYAIPNNLKSYSNLMAKARTILHEDFGYKLINLGSQKWMIVNALSHDQIRITPEPEELPEQTLLFIILSHIYMSEDFVKEEAMFQFLRMIGILKDGNREHPYFGKIEELVSQKFIAQLYLSRIKQDDCENEIYGFSWGPRAKEEVDPQNVMDFVKKVYRDRPIPQPNNRFR